MATPTGATARSISRSRRCRDTASSRVSITTACRRARASTLTSTRRTMRAISCCGRRPSPASRRGMSAPAPDGRAGTSSVRPWRCGCWASRRSTSMPAAIDLIFPHHENEIAQSEGATKQPFVAVLGARRTSVRRKREDVEVARQRLHAARRARAEATGRRRCATCCCRRTTASS